MVIKEIYIQFSICTSTGERAGNCEVREKNSSLGHCRSLYSQGKSLQSSGAHFLQNGGFGSDGVRSPFQNPLVLEELKTHSALSSSYWAWASKSEGMGGEREARAQVWEEHADVSPQEQGPCRASTANPALRKAPCPRFSPHRRSEEKSTEALSKVSLPEDSWKSEWTALFKLKLN